MKKINNDELVKKSKNMSLPPPTSTFEGRLRRESRINVTTGKTGFRIKSGMSK
jgi:hypothetical protein